MLRWLPLCLAIGCSVDTFEANGDPCFSEKTTGRVECGGLEWEVSVPARCTRPGCGLIVDVHGFTMSGRMEEANTALARLGRARDYVVLQPSAPGDPPFSLWLSDRDYGGVYEVMMRAAGAFEIARGRVHFTGFSQGGAMTWAFVRAHADVLASAAPAADGSCDAEPPADPIDLLYMHGHADPLSDFACAREQIDGIVSAWHLESEGLVEKGDGFRHHRYTGAATLEFLAHDYSSSAEGEGIRLLGHCYPGSEDLGGEPGQLFSFKCDGNPEFRWGEEVIDFFDAHRK